MDAKTMAEKITALYVERYEQRKKPKPREMTPEEKTAAYLEMEDDS